VKLAWAAVLLVAGALGLFVWQPWRTEPPAEPLQAVAITTLPGAEQYPSLSPDGNHVVFTWGGPKQDNPDIYVQMIGQGSPLQLTKDPRHDYNPVWSPDGRWIAFFRSQPPAPTGLRSRELLLIAPLGGPERKLADIRSQDFSGGLFPDAVYLAWSSDSNSLIVTDSPGDGKPDALFVVSLETGEKRPLTNPQPPVLADTSPAVSPDGRSLVFLRRTSWVAGEIHLLSLGKGLTAAGEPKRLTSADLRADFPAWLPAGNEIIFSARGSLWRLAVAGETTPTRIPYVGEDGLMPVISRPQPGKSARLVYRRSFADSNLWRIETSAPGAPSSSLPVMVISSTKPEYHCEFSPDGRRVAFVSIRSGGPEIWVADPDGSNAIKLTSMSALDTNCPHWSPDGRLIAFSSTLEGEFDVYVVPAAGGKPRRLTSHPAIDINPTFSRDGKWIYFMSMRSGDYRIWKMAADGGDAVQVTPNQGGMRFESADGSNLYYLAVSVASPLWRLPMSGGEPVKVLDGIVWFNFWLLENGAYYIDRLGSETRLQYLNLATGKSTTVARNLGEVSAGLTASPDGRTILFTRVDSSTDDLMLVENFR
jgi:Tol biopolymer transport system component